MSTPPDDLSELPWPALPRPAEHLRATIRRGSTGDLRGRRGLGTAQRLMASIGLSLFVVCVMITMNWHGDASPDTLRAALFGAAGWALVLTFVLAVGFLRPPGRRGDRRLRFALTLGVPLAFFAYLALAASHRLPLGEVFVAGQAAGALGCGLHALLFGAIVGGGTLALWRGTDPFSPGLSGALAGLAAGLVGAIVVGVACPSGETWHLWLGHGAAVLVLAVSGWLAGRRWLTP